MCFKSTSIATVIDLQLWAVNKTIIISIISTSLNRHLPSTGLDGRTVKLMGHTHVFNQR